MRVLTYILGCIRSNIQSEYRYICVRIGGFQLLRIRPRYSGTVHQSRLNSLTLCCILS